MEEVESCINLLLLKLDQADGAVALTITPTEKCHKILNVTGGGITPVAQKIADMTGAEVMRSIQDRMPG